MKAVPSLVPRTWSVTRTYDCRIFEQATRDTEAKKQLFFPCQIQLKWFEFRYKYEVRMKFL